MATEEEDEIEQNDAFFDIIPYLNIVEPWFKLHLIRKKSGNVWKKYSFDLTGPLINITSTKKVWSPTTWSGIIITKLTSHGFTDLSH